MTPDEETYVTPPSGTAAGGPQPAAPARGRAGSAEHVGQDPERGLTADCRVSSSGRVLQAEHEQQQDDADLGPDVDEGATGGQRDESALAEGEPTRR